MRRRPTSIDVAERAGVSQSTVSRALSGSPMISEETRSRVARAAEDLGYLVDERASRLRGGKTRTLAVVVLTRATDTMQTANPFYFELLGSICEAAAARGLETLVSLQANESRLDGRFVEQGKADGLIVIGSATNRDAWGYFVERQRETGHMVFWGSPFEDALWVRSDNAGGGRLAVRHLAERGYRRIVFVGPTDADHQQFHERYHGYCAEMAARGWEPEAVPVPAGLDREHQGRAAIAALIEQARSFDAIFAASDLLAIGCLEELEARGRAVPGEVGVVGFDGMGAGRMSHPPLTTIAPDLAQAAGQLVDQALAEPAAARPSRTPVQLVARGSTRPAASADA